MTRCTHFLRSEEHTSELQSRENIVCRLLLGKKKEALQQRAQANNKISDAEKQKMSAQYQAKLQELAQLQQTVQGSVQSSIQQIRTVFDGRVKQIAEQLRKENNLVVFLNNNTAPTYDAKYDLTDKMIQKVNAIK